MFNLNYNQFASAYRRYASRDAQTLVAELGWTGQRSPGSNGALLTSLALLAAGAPLAGTHAIAAGPLAGRRVCRGANRLADWLAERYALPEIIPLDRGLGEVVCQLFGRRGIVAFIQGNGPFGGLIGLLDGRNAQALCCRAAACHPVEIRFWELR